MPKLRFQEPARLPGAADFSSSDDLRGSLNVVRLVKSQPWIWDELRKACELEVPYARHRAPGCWELVMIAFVASRQVDIQPWWDESSDELWGECGFDGKPPYIRVWRRLRELESVCEAFLAAAAKVIQRAKMHDGRVLAHVHFDWTEDETHASLVHDCQKGEACAYAKKLGKRVWGHAIRPARASAQAAREERHALAAESEEEADKREKASAPNKTEVVKREGRTIKRVRINGCWFRTNDLDAGLRAYTSPRGRKRVWHGYYAGKAVDHLTGAVIPSVDSASINESHLFPPLFDRVTEMAGSVPETVIADRGLSIESCFEHATKHGAAPIFPWRKYSDGMRHDHEAYDRHGVARCKVCGGDTEQIRFSANGGHPRLWFRCVHPFTDACRKEQTISCKEDWRTLIPLARTSSLYQELRESHQTYESAHDVWRDRYRVAADDLGVRPKVVSLGWHKLKSNVACLIDWLRVSAKAGWLAAKPHQTKAKGERRFKRAGQRAAEQLEDFRTKVGLSDAYGPQAKAHGLGHEKPPSRRRPPKAVIVSGP
jgi:hypothetical protein